MLDTVRLRAVACVRSERFARWAGIGAGVLAAGRMHNLGDLNTGILYAIPAFGLCTVAGTLLGDALTPRPQEAVRTAVLTPRRVRDYLPRRMTAALLFQAVFLVVLLAAAAAVASPGHLGFEGEQLSFSCGDHTEAAGPWPGLHYGLPILATLAVGTAACGWSLLRIARRPGDEQARRDRSLAITAAWGLLVSTPLMGVASSASGALMDLTCDGAPGQVATYLIWPMALVALVSTAWCFFTVVSPRAAVRR
ncbi:hypothetical protein [Streptomyces beijiangensis]|uniref:Uncharacterized protein n=1 Tax=Streptomyces beijiangensis TaxID=163361 RepID=A0A939JHI5_9ACTN|nr:hypothetical protein [Streptomyces beijiangensis]MBO0512165.1 hypothetical protein [Streptomyces beijiangensis]